MACNNIKLYNSNLEEVDAGILDVNEEYIIELTIPEDQEFVGWVDSRGHDISSYLTPISTPDGMDNTKPYYKFSPKCGLVYKALFKTPTQYICNVIVVSNNEQQGTAIITQDVPEGESYLGQSITIEAIPKCCYKFDKWIDRNGSYIQENPYPTPELGYGTNTYVAFFELESFDFTVNWQNDEGGVSIYVDGQRVETKTFSVFCGTVVHLVAEPNSTHQFSRWVDGYNETISQENEFDYVISCSDIESAISCEFTAAETATIVYHNGGEEDIIDSRVYSLNEEFVTFPREINVPGFQIEGMYIQRWATSLDPSEATYYDVDTQYPIPSASVFDLYAVWGVIYEITIPLNPGQGLPIINPIVGRPKDIVTLPDLRNSPMYELEGMTFLGWSTSTYSQNNLLNAQGIVGSYTIPDESVTLNAIWVPDTMQVYEVGYMYNSGTQTPIQPKTYERVVNNVYTVRGLDFLGWERPHYQFTDWENLYNPGSYVSPEQQIYLTNNNQTELAAQWVEDAQWSVTYHFDSSTSETIQVYDSTLITLNDGSTLSREGYFATGWKDADDEVNYNTYLFGGSIIVRSDMEFWPIWSSENCVVYLVSNDPAGHILVNDEDMGPGLTPIEVNIYGDVVIDGVWVGAGDYEFNGYLENLDTHEIVHGIYYIGDTLIYNMECGGNYSMIFDEVQPTVCQCNLTYPWSVGMLIGIEGTITPMQPGTLYPVDCGSTVYLEWDGADAYTFTGNVYDVDTHDNYFLQSGHTNEYVIPDNIDGHTLRLILSSV